MIMFRISKRFDFCSAHRLLGLAEHHPCGVLHGHNYTAELIFESLGLDHRGFAQIDYRDLDVVKKWIDTSWDHKAILCSNDPLAKVVWDQGVGHVYLMAENPTAENLARHLFNQVMTILGDPGHYLRAVRVSETPKTWAEYSE